MLPIALIIIALFALLPAVASADGLPAVGIDARPLSIPGGETEFVTKSGKRSTRLIEEARYGGVVRERRIAGSFSMPAVAYDGSPGGLSADGRTLVLISPRTRFPGGARRSRWWTPAASACAAIRPEGRLQLRRDLARRSPDVPGRVRQAGLRGVRRARLRHPRAAPVRRSRWWTRASRRGDVRHPGHARDERGRPLGLHALRRRRAPIRARARHRAAAPPSASTWTT